MRFSYVKWVCSMLLFIFTLPVLAQKQGQPLIDSLLKELPRSKDDTLKVKLLINLSLEYENVSPDDGIKYGKQALELAGRVQWKKGIARANNNIGGNYNAKSDFPQAMDYYLKALTINEELGDKEGIATNSVNIGIIYYNQLDYNKALDYYLKALSINETLYSDDKAIAAMTPPERQKLKKQLAANLVDIGTLYSTLPVPDYAKAREYYQRSLFINQQINNKEGIGEIYSNIGADFFAQNNYPQALKYDFMSLAIYQGLGNKDGISANLGAIGATYLAIAKDSGSTHIADSLVPADKSTIIGKAIEYLNNGIAICRETGNLTYIIQFSHDASDAYMLAGNCADAYKNLQLYTTTKDSVFSQQNTMKIEGLEKQREKELNDRFIKLQQSKIRNENLFTATGFAVLLLIIAIIIRYSRRVTKEKKRSDELLLNILPAKIAEELKTTGKAEARYFEPVTVIFTDFVDFTRAAEKMTPKELIAELDFCFKTFDSIVGKHNIEKIKTAGDAYIAVSGLPTANKDHALNMVNAALEIRQFMLQRMQDPGTTTFGIRLGIHSGNVVAGIVGVKKFAYDIWGDSVNTAARMEQNSEPGKINISQTTYDLVKDHFECVYRGEIDAKNKGSMNMYFVVGKK